MSLIFGIQIQILAVLHSIQRPNMAYEIDYDAIIIPIQALSNSANEYYSCSPKDSRLLHTLYEKFSIAFKFEWNTQWLRRLSQKMDCVWNEWFTVYSRHLLIWIRDGSDKSFVNFSHEYPFDVGPLALPIRQYEIIRLKNSTNESFGFPISNSHPIPWYETISRF